MVVVVTPLAGTWPERLWEVLAPFLTTAGRRCNDYWKLRDYYAMAEDARQNFFVRRAFLHEGFEQPAVAALIRLCLDADCDFVDLDHPQIQALLTKADRVREILESAGAPAEQVEQLAQLLPLSDPDALWRDLAESPLGKLPEREEDSPRLEQAETASAVQLETIVGAKGMSADHVIVLGCDETNLSHITRNAFFVALTRARQTLTLLACMGGGGAKGLHPFLRALPDDHTETHYLMAKGATRFESIAALDDQLGRMAYARAQGRAASTSKGTRRRRS